MAETIKLPFAFRTRVGPLNHVLNEVQMPTWKGQFWGGNRQTNVKYRHSTVVCAKMAESIKVPLACGLARAKSMCYMGGPDPHGNRQFWWIGAPIVKYRHFLPWAVQKRLNRSICRIGCGLQWAGGCTSSIVFARWRQCALMEGHVAVTCRITLNHPSTATMRLMSNYFDHLLSLDTLTYRVTQAKCIEPSTVLWAFHTIQPSS